MIQSFMVVSMFWWSGGQKKPIPFRRQRMEIDTLVPPSDDSLSLVPPPADDQYLADLLRVADNNLAVMKAENVVLSEQHDALEDKVNMFRRQVQIHYSSFQLELATGSVGIYGAFTCSFLAQPAP